MRDARDRSLFDVEDVQDMPAVRDMHVGAVSASDVDEFCQRYHYAIGGGNRSYRWGLWHGVTLLGIVAYNLPTRHACESVFGVDYFDRVWHMGRLALADRVPHNAESRLIGGSLRAIEHEHPEVWGVLTFAAIDAGHIGYVYQATNAIYTGLGGHSVYYVDQDGKRRPTYDGRFISKADARSRGWTVHDGELKHRYVYVLGSKKQRRQRRRLLKLPDLPYPKDGELEDW